MKTRLLTGVIAISISVFAALSGAGCRPGAEAVGNTAHTVYTGRSGGAYSAKNTDRNNLETRSKFVLMDQHAERSVTYNGIQERPLPDGRLEVAINLRNRLERRIQVQVQCVFKDIQGFSTSDETPWQSVIFTENSQETVKFASANDRARDYTIRVREAR